MADDIRIRPSQRGLLDRIAREEGGIGRDGRISREWAIRKLHDPNTPASTKEKLNFFLNMT